MADNPYLEFLEVPWDGKRKTRIVDVASVSGGYRLGIIKWYGPWRQYCFFPDMNTCWNKGCLETVTAKIDQMMANRREGNEQQLLKA